MCLLEDGAAPFDGRYHSCGKGLFAFTKKVVEMEGEEERIAILTADVD